MSALIVIRETAVIIVRIEGKIGSAVFAADIVVVLSAVVLVAVTVIVVLVITVEITVEYCNGHLQRYLYINSIVSVL